MSKRENIWLKVAVPKELHKKFKTACWLKNISMNDQVLKTINQLITKNQDQIEEAEKVRSS